jgi:hypothetical protein
MEVMSIIQITIEVGIGLFVLSFLVRLILNAYIDIKGRLAIIKNNLKEMNKDDTGNEPKII